RLRFRKHIKRRRPRILMKWAKSRIRAPRPPQLYGFRNEIDNLDLALDFFNIRHGENARNTERGKKRPPHRLAGVQRWAWGRSCHYSNALSRRYTNYPPMSSISPIIVQ